MTRTLISIVTLCAMVFVSQIALADAPPAETREGPASSAAEWDVVVLKLSLIHI